MSSYLKNSANNRLECAPFGRPIRKGEAPLLTVQPKRYVSEEKIPSANRKGT